jgi:hypothetical protein
MRNLTKFFAIAGMITVAILLLAKSPNASSQHFVVTNDNQEGPNTATIYVAEGTPLNSKLKRVKTLPTGGEGVGGGRIYFAAIGEAILSDGAEDCVFVSDPGSSDIAGIIPATQEVTGNFQGSAEDKASSAGMGLLAHAKYLYAAFTESNTIGTFHVEPGCKLKFVADTSVHPLNGGSPDGMAARGVMLILTYADGSIESFNIADGVPLSNGDEQFGTGYNEGPYRQPAGVDITRDGRFAIFGDAVPGDPVLEVSDVSSGKLTPTIVYGGDDGSLGTGESSNNIWIGPQEIYLYISNNFSNQVTAVRFHSLTGVISPIQDGGCMSNPLRESAGSVGVLAGEGPFEDVGITLAVAEYGLEKASAVGTLLRNTPGSACTFTESADSPASNSSDFLDSLTVWPPRPF